MKKRVSAILVIVLLTISLCAFNRPKEELGIDIEFNMRRLMSNTLART